MTAPDVALDTGDELTHTGDTGRDTGSLDPAPIDDTGADADTGVANSVANRTVATGPAEPTAADEGALVELTRAVLDTILPVGFGLYGEAKGSVTWGIPLNTGGHVRFDVHRVDEDHVDIRVFKKGTVGGDTGAGVSVFVGLKSRQATPGEAATGAGAEAGVNLQGGAKVQALENYLIPVSDLLSAVPGFLVIQAGVPAPMVAALIDLVLGGTGDVHLVGFSIEGGLYGNASGEVSAGIRTGTDNTEDVEGPVRHTRGATTWSGSEDERPKAGSPVSLWNGDPLGLFNELSQLLTATVTAEAQYGVGYQLDDDGTGMIEAFVEGQLQLVAGLPIPALAELLNSIPAGAGVGAKLELGMVDGNWETTHLIVYQFSGEDDFFAGSANRQDMRIDLGSLFPQQTIIDALRSGKAPTGVELSVDAIKNALQPIEVWTRFSLGGVWGTRFQSFTRRRQHTRSLLGDDFDWSGSSFGLRVEPYLTLNSVLTPAEIGSILQAIPPAVEAGAEAIADQEDPIGKLGALARFLTEFEDPALVGLVDLILDTTKVTEAELRLVVGVGGGAAGQVAALAKARADLSVELGAFVAIDVVDGGVQTLRWVIDRVVELLGKARELLEAGGVNITGPRDETESDEPQRGSGTGPQGEDDALAVRRLESSEDLPPTTGRRELSAFDISSPTLDSSSQPATPDEEHQGRLRFVFDGRTYSVDLRLGLRENDPDRKALTLVVLAGAWMEEIDFGFPAGEVFVVPYQRLLPTAGVER